MCEILINEDEDKAEPEEETKRTPIIHKAISPPINRHDKSLPPQGMFANANIHKWKKLEV